MAEKALQEVERMLRHDIHSLYGEVPSYELYMDSGDVVEVALQDRFNRPKEIPRLPRWARFSGRVGFTSEDGGEWKMYFKPTDYQREIEFYLDNPKIVPPLVSYKDVRDGWGYVLTAVCGKDLFRADEEKLSRETYADVGRCIRRTRHGHGDLYLGNVIAVDGRWYSGSYEGYRLSAPGLKRKVLLIDPSYEDATVLKDATDFLSNVLNTGRKGMDGFTDAAGGVLEGLAGAATAEGIADTWSGYERIRELDEKAIEYLRAIGSE